MLASVIFEPPNNAVLIAQVCLTASEDDVLVDVCDSVIWFWRKLWHS